MLFKWDRDAIDRFEEICIAYWRNMIDDTYLDMIQKQIGHIESDILMESLNRHLADTRTNSRGEPMGKYPPQSADLLSHSAAIEHDRKDTARKDQMAKDRAEYEKQRSGAQRDEGGHDQFLAMPSIKEQIRIGSEARQAITEKYRHLQPFHVNVLVMGALNKARTPFDDRTLPEALAEADRIYNSESFKDRIQCGDESAPKPRHSLPPEAF